MMPRMQLHQKFIRRRMVRAALRSAAGRQGRGTRSSARAPSFPRLERGAVVRLSWVWADLSGPGYRASSQAVDL